MTARSLRRVPMPNRWCPETLSKIAATPWSRRERSSPEVVFTEPALGGPEQPVALAPPAPTRRMRISDLDLRLHGFTDGCPQCSHVQRYGRTKPGVQHNENCRKRIIEAISQTEEGKARVASHEARVDRYMAEHIEHAVDVPARPDVPDAPRARLLQPYESPGARVEIDVAPSHPRPRDAGIPEHLRGADVSVDETHRRWTASRNEPATAPGALGATPAEDM